jgi:endo-1,4-beta-xylanase
LAAVVRFVTNAPRRFAFALTLAATSLGCSDESNAPPHAEETRPLGPLREAAAAAGKLLGAAVNNSALASDPTYAEILALEFDYVTPENATKWGPLEPVDDTYAWTNADTILDVAEDNAQAVKGHAFVWHQQAPSWLSALGADELRAAMKQHIETTLERYRGRVRAWDVVNEAVDTATESGYSDSVFYRVLGPSYIEDAFHFARAADPDVLLFYNEVGIERIGRKSNFTYELMRDLVERGVPIDGIGFQSHVSVHRYPSETNLRENLRRFAALGLRVNISELDGRTLLLPGDRDARWFAQRIAFQQIVGTCVLEPACEGITLWGFTDRYSWINDMGDPDDPLIFDRDYATKPAYEGVLAGLHGLLSTAGDNVLTNGDFSAGNAPWSASNGELVVDVAADRDGSAACLGGRSTEDDAIARTDLLDALASGGPFAFSSLVRVGGAASAMLEASLVIEEEGAEPRELSLATVEANDAGWTELSGYVGLGYTSTPTNIALRVHGAPASVELCVTNLELRPLSAP